MPSVKLFKLTRTEDEITSGPELWCDIDTGYVYIHYPDGRSQRIYHRNGIPFLTSELFPEGINTGA